MSKVTVQLDEKELFNFLKYALASEIQAGELTLEQVEKALRKKGK